jgi:hypothetical protein
MILHPSSRTRRLGIPGLPGGDRLARDLGRRLDDDHHWFREVTAGGSEPIDVVVVGPGGTFALTRDGENGRFARRNTGHWYRWNRSTESWIPWDPVPFTRARLAARRLSLYLERAGLPNTVMPILVPGGTMSVEVSRGDDLGVLVEARPEQLARSMSAEELLTQAQVDRIVALLDPRQPLPRLAQATRGG